MSTDYKSLQDILQLIIKKQKLDEVIERNELIEKFEEIVGNQIAKHVKIKNFEKGSLIIEIESSVWKNEIFLLREEIIKKINSSFGRQLVNKIVIL